MKLIGLFVLCGSLAASFGDASMEGSVPRPALPPISGIEVVPPGLTLEDGRDARRVLVIGQTPDGDKIDLTGEAVFSSDSSAIQISGHRIEPRAAGEGQVQISAAGHRAPLPVKVLHAEQPPVRFVRDVLPVMSKVGCNAGTCHGSAEGKNGFKLSLRGYDPEFDYQALVNDISGRRFNRVKVEQSLMLLKPTGEVPHEGGVIFKEDSREYRLLRDWIAQGTKFEEPATARASKIEVLPAEIDLTLPGFSQEVIVIAQYPDGTRRDVTEDAVITSNNEEVAKVSGNQVVGIRRGEAAILIRYEGNYAAQAFRVMGDRTGYEWVETPENNYVDQHVHAKLRQMKILPSEECSDAEFIRRVSLDLTGLPPSAEEVRAFLSDTSPTKSKRAKLIDELLASEEYIDFWANKWADLLQCNAESLGVKGVWQYRDWIRAAVAENKPYDKFVSELYVISTSDRTHA